MPGEAYLTGCLGQINVSVWRDAMVPQGVPWIGRRRKRSKQPLARCGIVDAVQMYVLKYSYA